MVPPAQGDWPAGNGVAALIRAGAWERTPLGPIGRWPDRLRLMVEQVLATPMIASLACGPERVLIYNDAAARLYGDHHPAALGRPLAESFPEGAATVEPLYARAFAGETVQVTALPLDTRGEGAADDMFDALLTPVRDEHGAVLCVHMVGLEFAGALGARESQARLTALMEALPVAVGLFDREGRLELSTAPMEGFLPTGRMPSQDAVRVDRWRAWDAAGEPVPPHDFPGARSLRGETTSPGLEMLYRDEAEREMWTSVSTLPLRDGAGRTTGHVIVISDIDALKRSTEKLRASEERQAFLLRLGDAMRREESAAALIAVACRLLGEALQASRIVFAETDESAGAAHIRSGWAAEGAQVHPAELRLADFGGPILDKLRAGGTVSFDDVGEPPHARPDLAALAQIGIRAGLSVPLLVAGRFVANLNVHQHEPRRWTPEEIRLTEEVAERIRAALAKVRAEEEVLESRRQMKALIEGVPQLVWRAVGAGFWTWASPQWTAFTGQAEPDSHGRGWLDVVHPDDRARVAEVWSRAMDRGEFHADYRVLFAHDQAHRWVQTRAVPVKDEAGEVIEWLGTSTDVEDLRGLQSHQRVLLHELQHRVRNTLGVVRSMASSTGRTSDSVEAFAAHLEGRLGALARTQMVLTRAPGQGVDLEGLVREELLAQAADEGQIEIEGPDVELSPKAAEVLALAVHELATNAVKYGALTSPEGRIAVRWRIPRQDGQAWLHLRWEESGVRVLSSGPRRQGFGTELIELRVPYELRGRGELNFRPGGVRCEITFPLVSGASILETGAPADTVGRGDV